MDRPTISFNIRDHRLCIALFIRGGLMVQINRWDVGRSEIRMERDHMIQETKTKQQAREKKKDDQISIRDVKRQEGPFFKE